MLLTAIATIPLLIWIYLLFARGGFWRISKHLLHKKPVNPPARRVVAVIPARNEAEGIGEAIASLLAQDFPAPLHIIVVDDESTDGTAEIAAKFPQVRVVRGQPLVSGWTGKLWALSQGVAEAESLSPDYLLFTDADIRHSATNVAELIALAEAKNYDLVSYMVKLACITTAEEALMPAFVFFFLKLYPPAWIRSNESKAAGAAGGCILIRPDALKRIGGLAAIRNEVIDDCALARAVKRTGGHIWLGLTRETESIRSYGTFSEIGRMISRTAFNQLHHSALLLGFAVAGLFVTYLLPPVLLLTGRAIPMLLGASAWLLMSLSYWPMMRFYRRSAAWVFVLPVIAVFFMGATLHSAVQYWRGRGGEWKGRAQDTPAP